MKAALWLIAAELAMVFGVLTLAGVAHASTSLDATRIAWYLKGQADALFAGRGWQTMKLACTPTSGPWVSCEIRVRVGGRGVFCDHALYKIAGFGITGHTSKPVRCGKEVPSS